MTKNYLPEDDTIEELLNITLSDEKKQELKEMRDQNVIATGKISEEDYQKVLNAFNQLEQNNQQVEETILNNPISRVITTRTVWNKQLETSVTEGLVSFDGEEPAWIPLRTIQGIYSYLSKTLNSVKI